MFLEERNDHIILLVSLRLEIVFVKSYIIMKNVKNLLLFYFSIEAFFFVKRFINPLFIKKKYQ